MRSTLSVGNKSLRPEERSCAAANITAVLNERDTSTEQRENVCISSNQEERDVRRAVDLPLSLGWVSSGSRDSIVRGYHRFKIKTTRHLLRDTHIKIAPASPSS